MTSLTQYKSIQSNLFVKIECPYYKSSAVAEPIFYNFLFNDSNTSYTLFGEEYLGLGKFLSITSTSTELRTSANELTITLSAIPNTSIEEIIHSRIKGSKIIIRRGLFDAETNQQLNITGNPSFRFVGYINNLGLEEEYDVESRTSSNTLVLNCSSVINLLDNKISGRKTNPSSMKKYFPDDVSMDRIPALESSYFDFGAKR